MTMSEKERMSPILFEMFSCIPEVREEEVRAFSIMMNARVCKHQSSLHSHRHGGGMPGCVAPG